MCCWHLLAKQVEVRSAVLGSSPSSRLRVSDRPEPIVGDLTVQENGSAIVHGLIAGTLLNCGGTVAVFGTVGSVRTEGGTTTVSPYAVISSTD